jgi:hypothetical protein
VCGRVAGYLDGPVTVTLLRPPPLDTPMTVEPDAGRAVRVRLGDTLVAEAVSTQDSMLPRVPGTVTLAEAHAAEGGARYFQNPLFPACFVCGPARPPSDGLRVFPGPVPGREVWAAPWTPDASLADGSPCLPPEFVWAVLDCPSGIASVEAADIGPDLAILLGRMTAGVAALPVVGEPYRVLAWPIARDGRKLAAGSALVGPGDEVLAVARTLWLTVPKSRPGAR